MALLDLLEQYEETKRLLLDLRPKYQNNPVDREIVSSMINEVSEVIQRLHGYEIPEKKKRVSWSPEWLERQSVNSFEDEVIARLDGDVDEWDDYHLKMDIAYFLTERQMEIAQLIASGYTRSKVAELLGIEKGTVNQILRTINKKSQRVESIQTTIF